MSAKINDIASVDNKKYIAIKAIRNSSCTGCVASRYESLCNELVNQNGSCHHNDIIYQKVIELQAEIVKEKYTKEQLFEIVNQLYLAYFAEENAYFPNFDDAVEVLHTYFNKTISPEYQEYQRLKAKFETIS